MIEHIECFNLQLHVEFVVEMVVLPNGQIALYFPKATHEVSRRIPLGCAGRQSEGWICGARAAIEDPASGIFGTTQVERSTRNYIYSAVVRNTGYRVEEESSKQINGKGSAGNETCIHAPAF